jgi:hypothetical protein
MSSWFDAGNAHGLHKQEHHGPEKPDIRRRSVQDDQASRPSHLPGLLPLRDGFRQPVHELHRHVGLAAFIDAAVDQLLNRQNA